jgi:hypothetical protein
MARARTEITHNHAGSEVEDRDHGIRVAQTILSGSPRVQPSAERRFQASSPMYRALGGSGGRIRTYDQAVNSRPLYH